jgi:hypothetical protein
MTAPESSSFLNAVIRVSSQRTREVINSLMASQSIAASFFLRENFKINLFKIEVPERPSKQHSRGLGVARKGRRKMWHVPHLKDEGRRMKAEAA